jgi:peptidyl-prolyl cis-trans isomerase C
MTSASNLPAANLVRRLRASAACAALALALATGGALAQTASADDKVVAKVDGMTITEKDLALAAEDLGSSLPQTADPQQKRDYLVGYMVDLKLGARAATQAKIGDDPDFQRRMAYFRDKMLLDDYLQQEAKKAVTAEGMRKLYDDSVKNIPPEEEVHARHILVPTEEEAKKVEARVKGGEDFAKVAGEVSKDPGSGKEGGDLGWFTKDRMVPEFADAAFKLQPGQVSDPVKSQFGWHVIKLEEKRQKPVPSFDDVKDQVAQYMQRKAQSDIVLGLRSKGTVERLDKPATPAAPATPAPAAPADPAAPAKKN